MNIEALAAQAGPLISTPFDKWCENFAHLIREAALTEKQEPVAWRLYKDGELYALRHEKEDRAEFYTWEPLYLHPAPVNQQLLDRITKLEQALDVALDALEKSMYPQKLQLDAIAKIKELK